MKSIYHLRSKRRHRPVKPEFAMTGVMVGIAVGWIVGLGLELVYKQKTTLMLAASMAGMLLGAAFETIRFQLRMHRFRAASQPKHHQIS